MKVLEKIAISTVALTAVATPMSALAASAHGSYGNKKANWRQPSVCRDIDMKQQNLIDRFDFHNSWQLNRFQQLVNKENLQNCQTNLDSFDYLQRFGNFESLVASLKYTGLDKTLAGPGKFTIFAPTDNAFAKLPPAVVQSLLTDPAKKAALTDILLYHVVSGAKVDAATAKALTTATMADNKNVSIKVENGKLFINQSQVVLYDIKTSNGIIHVIDTVLMPS